MRSQLVLALSLALTIPVHAADGGSAFGSVPAGARVRLTLADRPGTVSGSLLPAGADSLRVMPAGGGPALVIPSSSVGSLAYLDAMMPSPRKATLLGIGLGAAGGALIGIVVGQAPGEGGGGGEGGGLVRDTRLATTAVTPAQAKATNGYRAVLGAVAGGLVGGLLGSLTGLGMTEAHWTSVTPAAGPSSWTPAPAAPAVFAVRIALPFGATRR